MFSHDDWPWVRITGGLGVGFFVVMLVAFGIFIPGQPVPTDPIAEIEEFFADDAALMHSANWIAGVSLVFLFLPFAAGLRAVLGGHDLDGGMWARAAYGAAVALVAVTGAGTVFLGSGMLAAQGGGLDGDVMQLLLWADAFAFSFVVALGIGLFLAATSVVVLRTGVLWKWLGWLGLAIALVCLVGAWWPVDGDPEGVLSGLAFLSLPLLGLWSLLAGINLLRAPTPDRRKTAAVG